MDLASLLSPMTVSQFRESWNCAALALRGRPDRFAGLAFDFDQLWRTLHLTHTVVNAQFFDATNEHREMAIEPIHMADCFAAGMTICISNIDAYLPELAGQSRALKRSVEFSGTMNFSCYWSPDRGGFGTHYDNHAVWIMQLRGRKQWWYSRSPAIAEPRANLVYAPAKLALLAEAGLAIAEPVGLADVVLEPGDLLYLPAGTWHRTQAVGGESLALTLRAIKGAPDQIVHHVVQTWMGRDPRWRRPLPVIAPGERIARRVAPVTAEILAERLAALKQHVAGLTVDDLARAWAELGSWSEHPAASRPLTEDARLAVCGNVTALRASGRDGRPCLFVFDGQSELALPEAEAGWVERALAARAFTAGEACGWETPPVAWEHARGRLEEMIEDGLLELRG